MASRLIREMKMHLRPMEISGFFRAPSAAGLVQAGCALLLAACWASAALWAGWRLATLTAPAAFSALEWRLPNVGQSAAQLADLHWFGQLAALEAPMVVVQGVFSPGEGSHAGGFAVIEQDGQLRYVQSGQELADGWRLVQIRPDGVSLQNGEQQQFYPLASRPMGTAALQGDRRRLLPPPAPDLDGDE
jgi:hypothetical protein